MTLLRLYEPDECGVAGYPYAWHVETQADDQSNRNPGDGPRLELPIKDLVREQADYRCIRCHHPYPSDIAKTHPYGEWTPCDWRCVHGGPWRWRYEYALPDDPWTMDYPPHHALEEGRMIIQAAWRILTVHHLNGNKADCRWWNLAALCQRCHLTIQGRVVMDRAFILEHSEWFKPYAAGFYAWKYMNEDLTREQTLERLDELLALERLA
jgi:hypothetical protein